MAQAPPAASATARTLQAKCGSDDRAPGDSPWPGASNVTTAKPVAVSGSTNAESCAPRPSHPCTRSTTGPLPQRHAWTGLPSTVTWKRVAVASTSRSRPGRGWRCGFMNRLMATREAAFGAVRDRTPKAPRRRERASGGFMGKELARTFDLPQPRIQYL